MRTPIGFALEGGFRSKRERVLKFHDTGGDQDRDRDAAGENDRDQTYEEP